MVYVSFVVSGTWFGVNGSECLMQSSEQNLFTDHMNACALFPFKLTLTGCQHGVWQPAEIWRFFCVFYAYINVIVSSLNIVGWFV